MVGAHQNLNGSRDLNHAPWFVIHALALATINTYAKFEISTSTRYEDMKGNRKCSGS